MARWGCIPTAEGSADARSKAPLATKSATLLGLLDLGAFPAKLAAMASSTPMQQKPPGAVAGGNTLTSTATTPRPSSPNAATGISPGGLPALTPSAQGLQAQPQMMNQASPPAQPGAAPTPQAVQAPAQPAQQAQNVGTFKPSTVFSVPHPASPMASQVQAVTTAFTPPAAPQQPKMAGLMADLAAGRVKEAQPPRYPNALPQGGSYQGGWYIPPNFQPGQAWPTGYRAPGYAGPGTPGLPGFPGGAGGVSPGGQTPFGQHSSPPNPFQDLDDKAQHVEQMFVSGKINQATYGRWQQYFTKHRAERQKRLDVVGKGKPVAAPDFEPPGAEKAPAVDGTWQKMQDQRAQQEAEYAKRQGLQKEIEGYTDQTNGQDAWNNGFQNKTIAEMEQIAAKNPAIMQSLKAYKENHMAQVLHERGINDPSQIDPAEYERLWNADKQKLTVKDYMGTQGIDHVAKSGEFTGSPMSPEQSVLPSKIVFQN
jgi:hypothetical protein